MDSKQTPDRTMRELLDYLVWITREMRQLGHHSGSDREEWCRRVQQSYAALFIPVFPGHGDPYPPDVPPARNPGIWPDVPSSKISGMTLRHQLTVAEMVLRDLRARSWTHARPEDIGEWDRRLSVAFAALDHGEAAPMPDEARTEASREAIEQAEAVHVALKKKARQRAQEIKKQLAEKRAAKKAAAQKKAAAPKKAATPDKVAAPKKAATPKKAAASKKTAAPKKAAAKKKATAKKKAVKKAAAKKKAAPKKKKAPAKKKS